MIASYTANLAAFLTVVTLDRPINSVVDLANQNEIWYGAVNGGSTAAFFAKSDDDVYARLYQFMSGTLVGCECVLLILCTWQAFTSLR